MISHNYNHDTLEVFKVWVSMLRSGDYEQVSGSLFETMPSGTLVLDCCDVLGVLLKAIVSCGHAKSVLDLIERDEYGIYPGPFVQGFILGGDVFVETPDGRVAGVVALNDSGYTFEELADMIEKSYNLRSI